MAEQPKHDDVRSAIRWAREHTDHLVFSSEQQLIRVGYDRESGEDLEVCFVLRHPAHNGPCGSCHVWERAVLV